MPAFLLLFALLGSLGAAEPAFERFWDKTRAELSALPLEPRLEPDYEHSDKEVSCFKASYVSLHKVLIHARYCRPAGPGRFPAVLISPWYSQSAIDAPAGLAKRGVAALWFQARGFRVDQSSYPLENSWYILSGIDKPETYVYREIVCHALRGLDFLARRPEVDPKKLAAMGASQGGGLSLLAAGLDLRVALAAADFPFLSDWEDSLPYAQPPYGEVRKYIQEHPDRREAVMKTVSYFDTMRVAVRIRVPVLVNVGLKDRTCPPQGVKAVFARIKSRSKRLQEYPDADHNDRGAERWKAMEDFVVGRLKGP